MLTGFNVGADDYISNPFSIKEVVARIEELPESGLRVFFCQNDFVHSKFIIVDDVFSTVDTTNLDFRSLETNFEVNVFIYNEEFTAKQEKQFKADLQNCREIILVEWKKRKWHFKLWESVAHLVSPLM